ncbi:hypothetical protein FAES_4732 [Fibrella aestuarina BUZ 2]|uniref:Uncharacterized protein n=1 Tax=Fibrella aestuarina BUZ 2 TaxID=1166018 RepID=I0KF28_9BACT|nr:hypothetical protein FAES_4732 [Fibrella aestuarina BUZ 2]
MQAVGNQRVTSRASVRQRTRRVGYVAEQTAPYTCLM